MLQGVVDEVSSLAEVGANVEAGHIHRGDTHELQVAHFGIVGRVGAHVAAVSRVVGALSRVEDVCDSILLYLFRGECRVPARVKGGGGSHRWIYINITEGFICLYNTSFPPRA